MGYPGRMTHDDARSLIAPGVPDHLQGGNWADLGAGSGVFAYALSDLLGTTGRVIAVDRDRRALARVAASPMASVGGRVDTLHADFTRPLELSELDGILLANSLHFVRRQEQVLSRLVGYLKPGGRVLLVEYDTTQVSPWNPYPVPPTRFQQLAAAVNLRDAYELNRRPSRFGGREFYVGAADKP